jgi:hypothetical protein
MLANNIQITKDIITAEGNPEREKPQPHRPTTAPAGKVQAEITLNARIKK